MDTEISLVTVYRHLEAMSRQGNVAMVTGNRGEARYRLRSATTAVIPSSVEPASRWWT